MLSSFGAFIKYIISAPKITLNNHWRSFYWSCRPCEEKYDYVTRIENGSIDSNFVFTQFQAHTRLPTHHSTSTHEGPKPSVESYYAVLPRSAVISLYRRYYLDFVTFAFSPDQVEHLVNLAQGDEFRNTSNDQLARERLTKAAHQLASSQRVKFNNMSIQYEDCN